MVARIGILDEVPLPAVAEERMANFADLITTAISNAEARTELTASRAPDLRKARSAWC